MEVNSKTKLFNFYLHYSPIYSLSSSFFIKGQSILSLVLMIPNYLLIIG